MPENSQKYFYENICILNHSKFLLILEIINKNNLFLEWNFSSNQRSNSKQ